jgi:hypothetical protein
MNLAIRMLAVIVVLCDGNEKLIGYIPINRKGICGFAAMSRSAAAMFW